MNDNKTIFKAVRKYLVINCTLQSSIKAPLLLLNKKNVLENKLRLTFDPAEYERLKNELTATEIEIDKAIQEERRKVQDIIDKGYAEWVENSNTHYNFRKGTKIPFHQIPDIIREELAYLAAHPEQTERTVTVEREIFASAKADLMTEEEIKNIEQSKLDEVIHLTRKLEG